MIFKIFMSFELLRLETATKWCTSTFPTISSHDMGKSLTWLEKMKFSKLNYRQKLVRIASVVFDKYDSIGLKKTFQTRQG